MLRNLNQVVLVQYQVARIYSLIKLLFELCSGKDIFEFSVQIISDLILALIYEN